MNVLAACAGSRTAGDRADNKAPLATFWGSTKGTTLVGQGPGDLSGSFSVRNPNDGLPRLRVALRRFQRLSQVLYQSHDDNIIEPCMEVLDVATATLRPIVQSLQIQADA